MAALEDEGVDASMVVNERDDVVSMIVDYATQHTFETITLGAVKEGILQRVLFGEIPETVGEEFDGQVIMV